MAIADRAAERKRCTINRPRIILIIKEHQAHPTRQRFQMEQSGERLACDWGVGVMAVLQSEAEPMR